MRALLDTHVFLWWNDDDPRVSDEARRLLGDPGSELVFSAVSGLEIAIKFSRGRLDIPEEPSRYVPARIAHYGYEPLPIGMRHALRVGELPHHHGDPFDRLLIAQAQVEGVPIITSDANIARYDVEVIW